MADKFEALKQKMTDAGLAGKAGWKIVLAAGLAPPTGDKLFGDSEQIAVMKVMKTFNAYGRQKWTWTQSASSTALNGGMVKGGTSSAACGTFNANFRWLCENALGLDGFSNASHLGHFITKPAKDCIDGGWKGNVKTGAKGFSQLNCYKFKDHYWIKWKGANLDVCFNHAFPGPSAIVLSDLVSPDPGLLKSAGYTAQELYKLASPTPDGTHLVMTKKQGGSGWPEWMIVPEAKIPKKK